MPRLPDRPNSVHLKKQAKDLLRSYRSGDPDVVARFGQALPSARNLSPDDIISRAFRLHDAQSCIAREYGFASWDELTTQVEARSVTLGDQADRLRRWLALVYGGDVTGSFNPARPHVAARVLLDAPGLEGDDPYAACAAQAAGQCCQQATASDPGWVNRPGGPFKLPPLVAVTHSRLGQLPEFHDRLRRSAQFLLEAGADPNQAIGNRFPPASLDTPDETSPLSALYGAAGANRDPALTELLLVAGADPNDGESLYHSLENPDCTRVLLSRGARVAGTNALRRSLDMADPAALELLLAHGGDSNEPAYGPPTSEWGAPLLRAIALRRSARHIEALLAAGADPSARTPAGIGALAVGAGVGMLEVADILRARGCLGDAVRGGQEFVAACARSDAAEDAAHPNTPARSAGLIFGAGFDCCPIRWHGGLTLARASWSYAGLADRHTRWGLESIRTEPRCIPRRCRADRIPSRP